MSYGEGHPDPSSEGVPLKVTIRLRWTERPEAASHRTVGGGAGTRRLSTTRITRAPPQSSPIKDTLRIVGRHSLQNETPVAPSRRRATGSHSAGRARRTVGTSRSRRSRALVSGALLLGGVVVGGAAITNGIDGAQAADTVPALAPLAATATPEPRTLSVTVDGATQEVATEAATLAAALTEAGSVVDADDVVSAPLADAVPLEPVTVERVSTSLAVSQETQPFTTTEVPDPNRLEGERTVVTAGVDGVTQVLTDVTVRDGVEVARQEVARAQVTARVDEVVSVGTMKQAEVATPTGARGIAAQMIGEHGWGQDQFQCLDRLWQKESNWTWNADNPTSSAYGIPQALPGSKMASAGADWATNPATQIRWGLGYISDRYGTPCAAWGHSQAKNWY